MKHEICIWLCDLNASQEVDLKESGFSSFGDDNILFFFQNEENFIQLDKLDKLDRINHAWIWFKYSLTEYILV